MIMMSHTKANIKQRVQDRDSTWTLDTSGTKMGIKEEGDGRIRMLTVLEVERLMGFPDGWTDMAGSINNVQRYKCLGNAVVPAIVKMIGERLSLD